MRKEAAEEDYLRTLGINLLCCWKLEKEFVRKLRETIEVRMSDDAERSSDPSPVPLRLVETPAAGHPLPKTEIYREGLIRLPFASFAARKGLV